MIHCLPLANDVSLNFAISYRIFHVIWASPSCSIRGLTIGEWPLTDKPTHVCRNHQTLFLYCKRVYSINAIIYIIFWEAFDYPPGTHLTVTYIIKSYLIKLEYYSPFCAMYTSITSLK